VLRETRASRLHGHILALPFSDRYGDAVAEALLATGLHRTSSERAKFALAAHVEPLGAAFACCIWIYVAAVSD
jgi:coiled-coil and C2 domain-containing protein 2A